MHAAAEHGHAALRLLLRQLCMLRHRLLLQRRHLCQHALVPLLLL